MSPTPPSHPIHILEASIASCNNNESTTSSSPTTPHGISSTMHSNSTDNYQKQQSRLKILRAADFLYGSTSLMESAIAVLDNSPEDAVTNIVSDPSNQSLFLVRGTNNSSAKIYLCLPEVQYCSCRSFFELVRQNHHRGKELCCKHLLAVRLAPALQYGFMEKRISDVEYTDILARSSS